MFLIRVVLLLFALSVHVYANSVSPLVRIESNQLDSRALGVIQRSVETASILATDIDVGETTRLHRQAREAATEALATLGYFMPELTLRVIEGNPNTWLISITPGPRSVVGDVNFSAYGGITSDAFADRLESIKGSWGLYSGRIFRNDDWESAKRSVILELQQDGFPTARWIKTLASVDAENSNVLLVLVLDSGPYILLGDLKIDGLSRVPEGLVERYVNYTPATPYLAVKLTEWQQQLQESAFFRGVRVELDFSSVDKMRQADAFDLEDQPAEMTLPLIVSVNESRPRRASIVLGADSDVGARVEGIYRQNVVMDYPVALETGAHIDSKKRFGFVDLHFPPNASGARYSTGVLAQDTDIEGLYTRQFALGLVRTQLRRTEDRSVDYETRLGARVSHETSEVDGDQVPSFTTNTATATWDWTRRALNDNFDPRDGTLFGFGLGAGTEFSGNNQFARLSVRAQRWWPIAQRDVFTVRSEIGQLWARQDYRVPQDFLFRTGGALTVRGYRFLSLGRQVGDAVLGDNSLFIASAEYTHYTSDLVGIAGFVDTGNVADSFGNMSLATGVGVGARVRTPAGPIRLDIAYGVDDARLRLHFSLGLAL